MNATITALGALLLTGGAEPEPAPPPFLWGAASAAYQVEGAAAADGKGRSIWDHYLDDRSLAGPGVSGAVAIDFYNRDRYLQDIALMKRLGLNSYRFSVSWPRILPDGQGPANPAAIAHYRQFILDLKAAGIEPVLTLYHWDMPLALAGAGGWESRQSIDWYRRYAEVVFANFSDLVDLYVLVNEPLVEFGMKQLAEQRMSGEPGTFAIAPGAPQLGRALKTFNHVMLAAAAAKASFDQAGYQGRLGIAVPLFPVLTADQASAADRDAAELADGVMNRWFLDALYHGRYPADVLHAAEALGQDAGIASGDAETIGAARFDYLGINYYSALYIRRPQDAPPGYAVEMFVPEGVEAAFNGPVRPDQFRALFARLRAEYGNPPIIVTENGAGFPDEDVLVGGAVNDRRRCRYIVDHVAAMQDARAEGSDVRGYHVWSSHDNLEWLFGYGSRFGMIYVDFDTQRRTPKRSAEIYSRLIQGERVPREAC